MFPAEFIDVFEKCRFCKKCSRKTALSGLFLCCDHCGSRSLVSKTKEQFDVRLSFVTDNGKVSLFFPRDILEQYAGLLDIDLADDDKLQESFLVNDLIEATYSRSNVVVSVSKK